MGDEEDEDEIMTSSQLENQALLLNSSSPIHLPPPPPQPWGRLMPCSSSGQITQLFPRSPSHKYTNTPSASSQCAILSFGEHPTAFLRHVKPCDIFNVHTIGRSTKCDVQAKNPSILSLSSRTNITTTIDKKIFARQEWCYGMISNRHCKIYCTVNALALTNADIQDHDTDEEIGNKLLSSIEVWVEDCSGNGTVINGTTLLMKGDKRLLHSGDEICLVQKQTLQKKVVSRTELQNLLHEYSFVFVNCATNHHVATTAAANDIAPRIEEHNVSRTKRKAAVDVRATKSTRIRPSIEPQPPPSSSSSSSSKHGIMSNAQQPERSKRRSSWAPSDCLGDPDLSQPPSITSTMQPPSTNRRISPRRQQPRRVQEDYDIRDVLGSGTMGEVRRAIHRRTGAAVAIKVIPIKRAKNGNHHNTMMCTTTMEIEMEATILQKLQHPYIVKLMDVYMCPTAVYLVMELVQGGDLFDRIIKKGNYSEVDTRRVMRRLLAAVHYLHESSGYGIVHRDLKPENILLTSDTCDIDVKLTDFGLAKQDGDLKTFCGTPQYFAPEVLRRRNTVKGNGRYGKQADMWSLGVILYVLLTGSPPFEAGDNHPHSLLSSQSNTGSDGDQIQLYFPSHISLAAQDMVRQLLQHDPKKRASIISACAHEWILQDDGDTHIHPLDDPKLQVKMPGHLITSVPNNTKAATTPPTADVPIATSLDKTFALDIISPPTTSAISAPAEKSSKIATSAENFSFKKDLNNGNHNSSADRNLLESEDRQQQRQPLLPILIAKNPMLQAESHCPTTASRNATQHVPSKNVTPTTDKATNVNDVPSITTANDKAHHLTIKQGLVVDDVDNDEIMSRFSENTESVGSFSTANTYEIVENPKAAGSQSTVLKASQPGGNKAKSLLSKKKRSLSNMSPSTSKNCISGKTVKQSNRNQNTSVTTRSSSIKKKKTTRFRTNIASPSDILSYDAMHGRKNGTSSINGDGRKQLTLNNWFKKHN